MMAAVFADTAFYVAIASPRDELHAAAIGILDRFDGPFVTTEFVLLEVATFFSGVDMRLAYVELVQDLRSAAATCVVPSSPELFDRGLAIFASRPDKAWSLTDCTSFVVMSDFQLTDALTADRHFGQAGFRALLHPNG